MDDAPTLEEFESHMEAALRTAEGPEDYTEALRMLESIRRFRKDYENVREYLKK